MKAVIDSLKKFYWNHGLITIFTVFNLIPTITALSIEVSYYSYRGSLFYAIIYYIIGVALTVVGYIPKAPYKKGINTIRVKKHFLIISLLLVFIGLLVAYKTLTEITDISTLQRMLMEGEEVDQLKAEISYGGLAGIFKMFACMPLCIFLISSSIYFFSDYDEKSSRVLRVIMIISFIALIIKTFIYFDRITLLAALLVFIHHFLYNKKLTKAVKIVIITAILIMAVFVTALRMSDVGFGEFLGLYFNLGVVNLEVLIEKQDSFNDDFSQTFLNPMGYIFKFFGLPYTSIGPKDYIWNDAQSYWGFLYIDFHWIGLFFMPLFGRVIRIVESYKQRKVFSMCFYFIFMYCLFSFFTIPIIRSIEFWLMILVALTLSKYGLQKYINNYEAGTR